MAAQTGSECSTGDDSCDGCVTVYTLWPHPDQL